MRCIRVEETHRARIEAAGLLAGGGGVAGDEHQPVGRVESRVVEPDSRERPTPAIRLVTHSGARRRVERISGAYLPERRVREPVRRPVITPRLVRSPHRELIGFNEKEK